MRLLIHEEIHNEIWAPSLLKKNPPKSQTQSRKIWQNDAAVTNVIILKLSLPELYGSISSNNTQISKWTII